MESLYRETTEILKKYKISANKNLGQNFLIDQGVIDEIIDASGVNKEDFVIEIGPGLGTLTKELIKRAGKVIGIELDTKMIAILKDRFQETECKIIHQDVLQLDLHKLIEEEKGEYKTVKVVANLPYYITTPIIMKLLEDKIKIESITVMIQKEVADRLTCIPGNKNSGAITYSIYYYAKAEKIYTVSNQCFIPEPEVTSEIIKLTLREKPILEGVDEKNLFRIIKAAFMQRRKTLLNGLANAGLFTKEQLKEILKEFQIEETIRAENLSIEQFAKISAYRR